MAKPALPLPLGASITVKSIPLGISPRTATVVEMTETGYLVHIDGDPPEWVGPVDWAGNVLIN